MVICILRSFIIKLNHCEKPELLDRLKKRIICSDSKKDALKPETV